MLAVAGRNEPHTPLGQSYLGACWMRGFVPIRSSCGGLDV
jgi:hypothetical protein